MHAYLAGLLGAVLGLAADVPAQGNSAEEVLTGRGLRKLSSSFALPEETELTKRLRQADALKKDLFEAQKQTDERRKVVEEKRKAVVACMQQRQQLRQQLSEARNLESQNRIVAALNEVGDRLVLLLDSKVEEQSLKASETKVGQLTDQFIEQLLKTRAFYDTVAGKYQALAAETAVKEAVEAYNRQSPRTYSLGPSPTFLSNGRRLAKLEESILSDSVDLRRGPGGLWHVTAVFNGSHSADIAVDTGASSVVLPWKLAEQVGLKPTENHQTVQLRTADGRVTPGKLVTADKIRVGKFTVENVECAVMPDSMPGAIPLLGLSFFKHFNFRIDNAAGKLTLARVDDH